MVAERTLYIVEGTWSRTGHEASVRIWAESEHRARVIAQWGGFEARSVRAADEGGACAAGECEGGAPGERAGA